MKINITLILLIFLLGIYLALSNNSDVVYPKQIEKLKIITENVDNRIIKALSKKEINFFETDKDINNWFVRCNKNNAIEVKRSSNYFSQGNYSMQVKWKAKEWGELVFVDFPEDWSNYKNFNLDIFNPNNEAIIFQIRIGDRFDASGFYDKSNKFITKDVLNPGWNTINLKISEIGKRINIISERKVIHLSFFTKDKTLYLDNMGLEL